MTFARTKIQPPRPRPGFVPRGAVQARLAQALLARRLVLLCAPGGYGKTTLLAEEIARMGAGHAVAWVSVDAGDDLHRLLDCMVTALEPYDPPWRTAPEALIAAAARGAADEQRKVAAELVNTLDACEVAHGVVVFDDVHRVDDPAFFQFLDVVVERLSPRWTVALTTRDEPPLALARLRARDELAELREVQLRFARDEARRLAAAAGVEASVADRLFERTHGWPAGMRIALGALGGGTLAALDERALRTVERPMFDFLVTEVLAQLRPELADFLLATSVLPELEATRCEAVTGTAHAARLLDEIERLGLFVDVLDAPARTLRLHDLFRDALLQRLELDAPQRLAELRARAAASEPDPVRRIGFLIAAGEHEQAAQLVFEHLPLRMPVSGPSGAVHVLGQFPAAFRERSPELLYVRGLVAYLRWEFGAMFELQQRAEAGFAARDDAERLGMARASRVMALIALGRMDEAGDLLATLRGERLSLAGRILMLNAESWLALDTGRGYEVAGIVDAMLDLLEDAGRPDLWYQTTTPNRFPGLRGMGPPLARHAELLLRVAGDEPTPLRAIGLLCQAWGALWRGRLDEARSLEERANADADWVGHTGAVRGHLLALGAFRHAILGDAAVAVDLARRRVGELLGGYREWGRYVLWFFAGRVAGSCGDAPLLREALREIDVARSRLGTAGLPERTRMVEPLAAQLAWLDGRTGEAIARWQDALSHEQAIDVLGQASEVRLRLARALARDQRAGDAEALLRETVARAREDEGPGGALLAPDALRELCEAPGVDAGLRAQLRAWCGCLDAACRTQCARDDATPAGDAKERPAPAVALSPREVEVLARIAAGDGNKQIARSLDLSLHTVKRHVANILAKLDVASRGQAAHWYRTHGS